MSVSRPPQQEGDVAFGSVMPLGDVYGQLLSRAIVRFGMGEFGDWQVTGSNPVLGQIVSV